MCLLILLRSKRASKPYSLSREHYIFYTIAEDAEHNLSANFEYTNKVYYVLRINTN